MTDPDKTAHALDLLDARGRQAAARLRTSVDDLLVDAPPVPLDSVVVDLRHSQKRRRRGWLIAAAILTVAGITTAVLLRQTHDQEGTVAGDNPTYLVPRSVPNGWEIVEARVIKASDFPPSLDVTITVYGDPGRDDPWSGPLLSVYESAGALADEGEDEGEPIDVADEQGYVDEYDGTVTLRVTTDDASVIIGGANGVDRDEVVTAAEGYQDGDIEGALPEGLELLARGPGSALATVGNYAFDGISLLYGGASSDEGQLVVVQRAGDADDAELLLANPDASETEVRGLPAYTLAGMLQWYEPSVGLVVTVIAEGQNLTDDELLAFAEDFEPGRPGEVDDIVKAYGGSGPFGRLQPGEVVVVEGDPDAEGQPAWQVVASDDGDDAFGLTFADGGGSTGMGVEGPDAWGTLTVDVASHSEAMRSGEVGVYGVVAPEVAEVVVETPGREPIRFELHEVEGIDFWGYLVFAGTVPVDLGPAEVVARSADGTELDRIPIDVTSGSVEEGGTGGIVTETETEMSEMTEVGSDDDSATSEVVESGSDSAEASTGGG